MGRYCWCDEGERERQGVEAGCVDNGTSGVKERVVTKIMMRVESCRRGGK